MVHSWKYDDATEGMIPISQECTLKSHMTLKLEGKERLSR